MALALTLAVAVMIHSIIILTRFAASLHLPTFFNAHPNHLLPSSPQDEHAERLKQAKEEEERREKREMERAVAEAARKEREREREKREKERERERERGRRSDTDSDSEGNIGSCLKREFVKQPIA